MWNERYAEDGYFYGTEPNDFLKERASHLPKGRVLSLAEGEGRNAVFLAGLGHEVTAVDGSAVGLEKAVKLAASKGLSIETRCVDLASFVPESGRYAAVVSISCHLPPALRKRIHVLCAEALLPGGAILLEAYSPRQLEYGTGGPKDPSWLMDLDEVKAEWAGGAITWLHAATVEREVREGKGHTGLASVTQLFGRKSE